MKNVIVSRSGSFSCLSLVEQVYIFRGNFLTSHTNELKDLDYMEEIGGSTPVRQKIADLFNKHISPSSEICTKEVVLGAGGSYILDALVEAICDPGDGIMVATPYWSGLDLSISIRNTARVLPINIPLDEIFIPSSIQYYKAALNGAKYPIRAVFICNPHNPLGQCYPRETLDSLFRFCKSNNLHYISDEVYALSTYNDRTEGEAPFISALSLSGDTGFVHVVYSLSKDFGSNGVRLVSQTSLSQRYSQTEVYRGVL